MGAGSSGWWTSTISRGSCWGLTSVDSRDTARLAWLNDHRMPPQSSDTLEFMRAVWSLFHGMAVRSKRMQRGLGVSGPQRMVIRVVGRRPGIAASEIAAALDLHPSTLTGILARLESRGYLAR